MSVSNSPIVDLRARHAAQMPTVVAARKAFDELRSAVRSFEEREASLTDLLRSQVVEGSPSNVGGAEIAAKALAWSRERDEINVQLPPLRTRRDSAEREWRSEFEVARALELAELEDDARRVLAAAVPHVEAIEAANQQLDAIRQRSGYKPWLLPINLLQGNERWLRDARAFIGRVR